MENFKNPNKLLSVKNFNENNLEEMGSREKNALESPHLYSPNNPPFNSGFAFLLWFLSVLFIAVVPIFFVIPYLIKIGIPVSDREAMQKAVMTDPNAVLFGLGGTILAHLLTIILAWAIVTKFNKYSFREMLGWKWGGFKFWHGAVILIGVYAIALTLSNFFGSQDNEMLRILRSSPEAVYLVAFLATFTAPLVEEVVYRGVLYSAFQRTFNVTAAVILVTVIFAFVHVPQYYPDFSTIISILLLSLVLTLIRVKTGNLLPCIIFHTVFNGIQSLLLILSPLLPKSMDPLQEPTTSVILHLFK